MTSNHAMHLTYEAEGSPPVTVLAGDEIVGGIDFTTSKPWLRNLSGERRAQIDEAVRIAAQRRYGRQGVHSKRAMLFKMALHNTVYGGMVYEVSKAWRDIQARHERA